MYQCFFIMVLNARGRWIGVLQLKWNSVISKQLGEGGGGGGGGGGVEKSKQSPVGVLWKSYRYKFRKIHRKTPVSKSLLVESFRPKAYNFIKKETSTQLFSCEFNEIFKNTLLTEHLRATASRESWE